MEEFLDNFEKMIHYGFLGVYKRLVRWESMMGNVCSKHSAKGDYIENRMFLEQTENVYIPENATRQSDEQHRFIKAFPELFRMCYQKNTRTSLYRCKRCGMVLRENRKGIFFCVSEKCNEQLEKRRKLRSLQP